MKLLRHRPRREDWFLFAATCVLVAGVWLSWSAHSLPSTDRLRYLEIAAVVATGLVVLLYTLETRDLRKVAELQSRSSERPFLRLTIAPNGGLVVSNHGRGPAYQVVLIFPEIPGSLFGLGEGRYSVFAEPKSVVSPKSRVQWRDGPTFRTKQQHLRTLPGFALLKVINNLGPGSDLRVDVVCLDAFHAVHRVRYAFDRGMRVPIAVEVVDHGVVPRDTIDLPLLPGSQMMVPTSPT